MAEICKRHKQKKTRKKPGKLVCLACRTEERDASVSPEASRILRRWARDDFYVYIRPLSSQYVDSTEQARIYWTVSVEFRSVNFVQKRGEGYNLSEIIIELDQSMPRRKKSERATGYVPGKPMGLCPPKKVFEQEVEYARKMREGAVQKAQKPKKLKKSKSRA